MTKHIKSLIEQNGAISVAQFMQEAMFNPLYGYYKTKKPIGKNGDFITAPEISQAFGEIIAAYFLNLIFNSKKKIALVEMGAGKGTLFYDIIFTIENLSKKESRFEEIKNRVSFNIIEISPSLRELQQDNLRNSPFQINWFQEFSSFKNKNSDRAIYFFANELFDCFPIHQFIRTVKGWRERLVDILNHKLIFVAENFNSTKSEIIENLQKQLSQNENQEKPSKENDIFEYSFAAINFMHELCEAIKIQGGIALIIDYGYYDSSKKSTLQALKNHQYHDPLEDVGNADITALVDFKNLENCAKKNNLQNSLITQREFLLSLGIEERRGFLQDNIAINRLIDIDKMGELFKCLIIWDNNL